MNGDKNTTLWEEAQKQAKSALDVWKQRNSQLTPSSSFDGDDDYANEQGYLNKELPQELGDILESWHANHSLDQTQKDTFKKSSDYLLKFTKSDNDISKWFSKQKKLTDLVKKSADDIASNGSYLDIKGKEDPNLESFDKLIQAYTNNGDDQLLDVIVKCISNNSYNETLNNLSKANPSNLTPTQQFLLVTCPNYILTCDRDQSQFEKVLKLVLPNKAELFTNFLPNIEKWTDTVLLCLLYSIRFILSDSDALSLDEKRNIQEALVKILLTRPLSDSKQGDERVTLIQTALNILLEIVRSEHKLLSELKKQTAEDGKLLKVLKQISEDNRNEKMQLQAFELVFLLVPEEEFDKKTDSAKVTELFVKNFNEALEDNKDREADELMEGLKGLVKSDEIKQQVVEQNALPSIIQYTKETTDNPAPLQVAYALAFNTAAKMALKEDKEFIDHVEKMKDSDNKDVADAAHGVMWKLKEEDKFIKEADENSSNKEADETKSKKEDEETKPKKEAEEKSNKEPAKETKESTDDKEKPEQYDMMISYCWAQKELCHKINDRLEKEGFSVWLDRDEMRGSIVESMAEAVENSKVVLICMSSNYKASTNCQAEAEYAFNRKSKIIPLMVEKDYKPDGWLGFMAGSKLYVDFADKDDEEFDKAYELLIAEIKRQEQDENAEADKEKTGTDSSTSKEPEPTPEPEPEPVQTRQYLSAGPVTAWTDTHVNEFLTDHELDPLVPVCKSMDGETLLEFHQACQAAPSTMLPMINKSSEGTSVPINTFFKFIVKLKEFQPPPKPLPKVYFRYNLIYGPSPTDDKSPNANDA